MLFIINKILKNIVKYYYMTIYVDKITMGFDNENYQSHFVLDVKNLKIQYVSRDIILVEQVGM